MWHSLFKGGYNTNPTYIFFTQGTRTVHWDPFHYLTFESFKGLHHLEPVRKHFIPNYRSKVPY